MKNPSSPVSVFAFRLKPKADLKKSILAFAKEKGIKAGTLITGVGSLEQLHLRFAGKKQGVLLDGHFEIVSLTGTFSDASCHLHICVSDERGKTIGGHLLDSNLIYTTAELVVGELTQLVFDRLPDDTYGYRELVVMKKN
jgi:hypothetical protein